MTTEEFNKLIDLVQNDLPKEEMENMADAIIREPDMLDHIHHLSRLQRRLPKGTDLKQYLDEQQAELFRRIETENPD